MEQLIKKIPYPVICRLSHLYTLLTRLASQGVEKVSSAELGTFIGQTAQTIRKDIHTLGGAGTAGTKYDLTELRNLIARQLGLGQQKICCVVGLGRLGSALLEHMLGTEHDSFRIVAGFDTNINRLETIRTSVDLYPAYRIVEVVRQRNIELALITVPPEQAQEVADRCCEGGARGLLNFTAAAVKAPESDVFVRSVDIAGELRILTAMTFTFDTM